jgi:hypothetical protein
MTTNTNTGNLSSNANRGGNTTTNANRTNTNRP